MPITKKIKRDKHSRLKLIKQRRKNKYQQQKRFEQNHPIETMAHNAMTGIAEFFLSLTQLKLPKLNLNRIIFYIILVNVLLNIPVSAASKIQNTKKTDKNKSPKTSTSKVMKAIKNACTNHNLKIANKVQFPIVFQNGLVYPESCFTRDTYNCTRQSDYLSQHDYMEVDPVLGPHIFKIRPKYEKAHNEWMATHMKDFTPISKSLKTSAETVGFLKAFNRVSTTAYAERVYSIVKDIGGGRCDELTSSVIAKTNRAVKDNPNDPPPIMYRIQVSNPDFNHVYLMLNAVRIFMPGAPMIEINGDVPAIRHFFSTQLNEGIICDPWNHQFLNASTNTLNEMYMAKMNYTYLSATEVGPLTEEHLKGLPKRAVDFLRKSYSEAVNPQPDSPIPSTKNKAKRRS